MNLISDVSLVYDFSFYTYADRKLSYSFTSEQVHHEKVSSIQLNLMNQMYSLALYVFDLVVAIRGEEALNN